MRELVIKQVDAFTTKPFSGNPAGVITEADGLTIETMQKIAGDMNLSESAFVTIPESKNTSFRIRYFTPSEEVDLSGHVTIATCFALIEEGRIPLLDGVTRVNLETNIGIMPIDIHFHKDRCTGLSACDSDNCVALSVGGKHTGILEKIMMHQPIKQYRQSNIPIGEIADILGVEGGEISKTGLPLEIISTGLEQLMIPVKSKETILNMHPDLIKLGVINRKFKIHTNHIFTLDTFSSDCVAYSRHFAPAVGMWEDPATGTASAGLGTYLMRHGVITSDSIIMEQGNDIECLARILVEIDQDSLETGFVRIGGLAAISFTRNILIDNGEIVTA